MARVQLLRRVSPPLGVEVPPKLQGALSPNAERLAVKVLCREVDEVRAQAARESPEDTWGEVRSYWPRECDLVLGRECVAELFRGDQRIEAAPEHRPAAHYEPSLEPCVGRNVTVAEGMRVQA